MKPTSAFRTGDSDAVEFFSKVRVCGMRTSASSDVIDRNFTFEHQGIFQRFFGGFSIFHSPCRFRDLILRGDDVYAAIDYFGHVELAGRVYQKALGYVMGDVYTCARDIER